MQLPYGGLCKVTKYSSTAVCHSFQHGPSTPSDDRVAKASRLMMKGNTTIYRIYVYTHIHTDTHTYIHSCVHTYRHTCIHAYIHVYMYVCMHVCMYTIYIYVYIYVYIYICIYICIYIYVYIYIYIYIYYIISSYIKYIKHIHTNVSSSTQRCKPPGAVPE